jgi:hypothetical protein
MQKYFFYTRRQIAKTNGQVFSDKWSNKKALKSGLWGVAV